MKRLALVPVCISLFAAGTASAQRLRVGMDGVRPPQ